MKPLVLQRYCRAPLALHEALLAPPLTTHEHHLVREMLLPASRVRPGIAAPAPHAVAASVTAEVRTGPLLPEALQRLLMMPPLTTKSGKRRGSRTAPRKPHLPLIPSCWHLSTESVSVVCRHAQQPAPPLQLPWMSCLNFQSRSWRALLLQFGHILSTPQMAMQMSQQILSTASGCSEHGMVQLWVSWGPRLTGKCGCRWPLCMHS